MNCQTVTLTELAANNASIISQDLITGSSNSHNTSHGAMQHRTLCNLDDEYWITAGKDSQILYFTPIKSSQKLQVHKVICPGRITAVALNKSNELIFVGIGEKTYLWRISTGDLLAILDGPFQPVSVIVANNSYVLIGSEDGSVTSWPLCQVITQNNEESSDISHTWRKHTSTVTDLVLGDEWLAVSSSIDSICHVSILIRFNTQT